MNIPKVQFTDNKNVYNYSSSKAMTNVRPLPIGFLPSVKSQLSCDTFIKAKSPESVTFNGAFISPINKFSEKFTKNFFRKLASEHLPCAYTRVIMVPRTDYDELRELGILTKRGIHAIKYLRKYEESMLPIEKTIFSMLESEAKKHPNLKLQELLKLKYQTAEKILINQQSKVLNKINLMARDLPKEDYKQMRTVINEFYDKIFAKDPLPEERFRRQNFINALKATKIKNQEIKNKILTVADTLPSSTSSVNSFIIKYSQPYKIKYVNGKIIKETRDSEELGLRLIHPTLASDEHIYPQKLYKEEELARINGEKWAKDLSDYRVTILTTESINSAKSDILIDDLIKTSSHDIVGNIQYHINALIHVDDVWMKKGHYQDAALLADYITTLRDEFLLRSKIINIDLGNFEKKIPQIKSLAQSQDEKIGLTKLRKKMKRAENKHTNYISENERKLENRKVQKHISRFSN